MPIVFEIKVLPEVAFNEELLMVETLVFLQKNKNEIKAIRVVKRSIDARRQPISYLLKVEALLPDEEWPIEQKTFQFQSLKKDSTCHIIGFGPAGIFAALQCLEMGIKPIIFERGKTVEDRIKDIANIHKTKEINPESNYCYGEGGAGTYSDGKLYTRSSKRGDVKQVLDVLVQHGADPSIAVDAHPHIGTNKLPKLIAAIRKTIIKQGGEVFFNTKVEDFILADNEIKKIKTADGNLHDVQHVILATGHSARDIFELLSKKNIAIEAKPFAMGVRIEHPQALIDQIQYKCEERTAYLPPSSYSLVEQVDGRGVFSFCMCPGGVICPAGTATNETVVNGWSSSKRNGLFANSGMVVAVNPADWAAYSKHGALAALALQQALEQKAFDMTGSIAAPAQRVEDFIQQKNSTTLPRTSYQPGVVAADLHQLLPKFIATGLQKGLIAFGNKMKGYRTNEAQLVGVESRTSSPVRIPRDKITFRHITIKNLIPCGEGAGYAGGIVSAALDGIACANSLQQ